MRAAAASSVALRNGLLQPIALRLVLLHQVQQFRYVLVRIGGLAEGAVFDGHGIASRLVGVNVVACYFLGDLVKVRSHLAVFFFQLIVFLLQLLNFGRLVVDVFRFSGICAGVRLAQGLP